MVHFISNIRLRDNDMEKKDIDRLLICRAAVEKHVYRDRSTADHTVSVTDMNNALKENGFADFDSYLKWDESKCFEHYQENFVIEGTCDGCVGYVGTPPCRVWALARVAEAEACLDYPKVKEKVDKFKELFKKKLPIDFDRKKDYSIEDQNFGRLVASYKRRREQGKAVFTALKDSPDREKQKVRLTCPPGHGYYLDLSKVKYKFDVGWGWDLWPSSIPNLEKQVK